MIGRLVVLLLALVVGVASPGAWQRDLAGPEFWQGSSTLTGVVIEDTSGAAVRRAVVNVQGPGSAATRSVATDDDGRFVLRNLPAGRYSVVARKAAWLDAAYGAKRPGRPGTAVHLDGGATADVSIRMARGAVVEGALRGEDGEPLPGIVVYAVDPRDPGMIGPAVFTRQEMMATTDDRGVYRIYGLAPGDYVIAASFNPGGDGEIGRRNDAAVDALLQRLATGRGQPGAPAPAPHLPAPTVGYASTFYPGTTLFNDAARVRVGIAEERRGLDFTVGAVATVSMAGAVVGDPERLAAVQLSFIVDGPRTFLAGSRPVLDQRPGPDGRFRYTSVPPGRYTIYARSDPGATLPARAGGSAMVMGGGAGGSVGGPGPSGRRDPWFATADVSVLGQDVGGISLVLQPGVTVSGRVAFDATSMAPPDDLSTLRVMLGRPEGSYVSNSADGTSMGNMIVTPPVPPVSSDGAFVAAGVPPGTYELRGAIPSDTEARWWLRSAMLNGRDLLDEPLEVRGQNLSDVVLTYTDRANELTGTFQTSDGQPASDYYVVAIPEDRSLWRAGSRRLVSTRPATDGSFSLTRIPSGAYRLAALVDFDPADFASPAFLEALASQGIPVSVRDGARTVQDIRVAQ